MSALFSDLASLLGAHVVDAPEAPFPNNGYSGANLARIEQNGQRYVVKRTRQADDWIMRHTGDADCREAQFAASPLPAQLPPGTRSPTLGAARDGDGWAILMQDISPLLLPEGGVVPPAAVERVLQAMAQMHAAFWEGDDGGLGTTLCRADARLALLSPSGSALLVKEGVDFGFLRGWRFFETQAPDAAVRLTRALFADMTPLTRVLGTLPQTLIHGDLKFANIGLDDETVWLIDWAVVARSAVAMELAWFLAVNSSRLPWPFDETIGPYAEALRSALGPERFAEAQWPRQRAVIGVAGLLLYGWGKALDAEAGRPEELQWWCAEAIAGSNTLGI